MKHYMQGIVLIFLSHDVLLTAGWAAYYGSTKIWLGGSPFLYVRWDVRGQSNRPDRQRSRNLATTQP